METGRLAEIYDRKHAHYAILTMRSNTINYRGLYSYRYIENHLDCADTESNTGRY